MGAASTDSSAHTSNPKAEKWLMRWSHQCVPGMRGRWIKYREWKVGEKRVRTHGKWGQEQNEVNVWRKFRKGTRWKDREGKGGEKEGGMGEKGRGRWEGKDGSGRKEHRRTCKEGWRGRKERVEERREGRWGRRESREWYIYTAER